jgi:hypothetical protein
MTNTARLVLLAGVYDNLAILWEATASDTDQSTNLHVSLRMVARAMDFEMQQIAANIASGAERRGR